MKKLILTLFTATAFINVQAQCNSNPYLSSGGSGGTVYFSDSSSVSPNFSTNYSVSYLWDFGDGFTSTQQSPCHTYGDLSNGIFQGYVTLSVTYLDLTTSNSCQDIDSVQVIFFINPCVYGDLQISASGTNLSADWTYIAGGVLGCANNYPDTYLWSNGDTTQTISINSAGTYTCTVTTSTGCVYTSTYAYNGSLTSTFDCNLIDFNELNNNQDTLTISSNYLNNNFPEVIDTLSYWEAYSTDGNVNLLAPLYSNPTSFLNIGGFNGLLCDTFIVCANVFLYDSLYQHNLQANPPLGSACSTCDTIAWDGTIWQTVIPNNSYDCDPILGCYDAGPAGPWGGQYASLSDCQNTCYVLCDSVDLSITNVVNLTATSDSITIGSNVSSLTTTGVSFEWIDWNGTGSTLSTDSVFSFVINSLDTAFYILKLELSDNNFNTWVCYYPVLVYWDNNQYVSFRTGNPMFTSIDESNGLNSRQLIKIVDLYGREVKTLQPNQLLFYLYDDGTIEKKLILE